MQNRHSNSLSGGSSPRRVLIVDDDDDVRELVALAISQLGHEVVAVPDGHSALLAVTAHAPEIAFMDIGLPDMDGYTLASRVRQLQLPSRLHLVALTGFGTPSDRERALCSGFDAHLVKPAALRQIEEALAQLDTPPHPPGGPPSHRLDEGNMPHDGRHVP